MRISDWSSDVCSSDLLRIVTLWDMLRLDLGESPQHTIPLLSGLSLRQARVFALMSKLEKHAAAERVIEEGDLARDIYVVVDGRLEVWIERRSEEHTSELQSLMRTSYALFFLKKKQKKNT